MSDDGIFIGAASGGEHRQQLELSRANRHGLIAGATGTGKTVTLQGIVEAFSAAGVPTFVADVKGDLAGLAMPGSPTDSKHEVFAARAADIGYAGWQYHDTPVQLWDLFGELGHPVRTTVTEMGPLLLARLMNLNEVQEGVLTIAFHVADKEGLLLVDLDDLQSMLVNVGERADELTLAYGIQVLRPQSIRDQCFLEAHRRRRTRLHGTNVGTDASAERIANGLSFRVITSRTLFDHALDR